MLEGRLREVLKAIVEEYVRTNEPVGSVSLINNEKYDLDVSSATIRNDMALLENMGLIMKTHTSSGRVPSEAGYREYVSNLLEDEQNLRLDSFPLLDEIFSRNYITRENALSESLNIVTSLTDYATMALGNQGYNSKIKKLSIIRISSDTAVILMVTDKGHVESRKIKIPDGLSYQELEKVINYLDYTLKDAPIWKIDQVLREETSKESLEYYLDYYDEVISSFVQVFTNMAQDSYYFKGRMQILNQPEFSDVAKAKSLIDLIESGEIFQDISIDSEGLSVIIGRENKIKAMQDCTIISIPYETSSGELGAIAVLGPTRMEYHKVISLLEYIARNIEKIK